MKLVFMGSADFGLRAFDALIDAGHEICAVVTTPPAPKGRGRKLTPSPIAMHAEQKGIAPILAPASLKDPSLPAELADFQADLFVVVAFRILPKAIFALPQLGTVNIHASLLPKFRGPAPIQRAIQAGETETGVTVFRIDAGIDTGAIITKKRLQIGPKETTPQLYERLATLGAETLVDALPQLEKGTVHYVIQDNENASPAPKLRKEEGAIDWGKSAADLYNTIRAFKPFPGTYTTHNGKQLSVEWASPLEIEHSSDPGTIIQVDKESFVAGCGTGALRVEQVRPEGKRSMDAGAFIRGYHIEKGQQLG